MPKGAKDLKKMDNWTFRVGYMPSIVVTLGAFMALASVFCLGKGFINCIS